MRTCTLQDIFEPAHLKTLPTAATTAQENPSLDPDQKLRISPDQKPVKDTNALPKMNGLDRLIPLQLHHQIRKPPIRLHQLRRRTHKPIRQPPHGAEKPILEDPLRLIHPIGQLDREAVHAGFVPRDGRDLRDDDGSAVVRVHGFEVLDAGVAVGAVVVEADEIGRGGGDEAHEFLEPSLAVFVVGDGGADEFLPAVLAQGYHLVVPGLGRALGGDVVLVRFVEEVDDGLGAVEDVLPVAAGELRFQVHHRAVGRAVVEFRGCPGVPVADGGEGAVEVGLVQGPGYAGVAGAGAVGPVPEETTLFDYHGRTRRRNVLR